MHDYSFLARRAIMPLIWCRCSARSRAGKGSTNYIFVGVLYFMMFKCPSWALCSLGRVDVRHTAMPGSGSTTPWWISPPPARSHLQSSVWNVGADGHLAVMKCASSHLMDIVDHERVKPCAKTPRQVSHIDLRLARKL